VCGDDEVTGCVEDGCGIGRQAGRGCVVAAGPCCSVRLSRARTEADGNGNQQRGRALGVEWRSGGGSLLGAACSRSDLRGGCGFGPVSLLWTTVGYGVLWAAALPGDAGRMSTGWTGSRRAARRQWSGPAMILAAAGGRWRLLWLLVGWI